MRQMATFLKESRRHKKILGRMFFGIPDSVALFVTKFILCCHVITWNVTF